MSNLMDKINNNGDGIMGRFRGWSEEKQAEREWAFQTIDHQAELTFSHDEHLYRHLLAQVRLMHQSSSNVLLLTSQLPQVSDIEKYNIWSTRGRPVKRGEKGLLTVQGTEYTKADGSIGKSWTTSSVFDISQTVGDAPNITDLEKRFRVGSMLDFMSMAKALMQNAPAEIKIVDHLTEDEPAMYKDGAILIPDVKDTDNFRVVLSAIYALGYGCTAAYRAQEGLPHDPIANACGGALSNICLGTLPPTEALEHITNNAPIDVRGKKQLLAQTRAIGEKLLTQIEKSRETYRTEHTKAVREQMIEHKYKNTERARS